VSKIIYGNDVHVVSIADNHYAQHLAVTFTSLLMNMQHGTAIHLYVLSTALDKENQTKLEKVINRPDVHIHFITVDESPYEGFSPMGETSRETYLRLAIPDVIPFSVQKVICLDSDVVITGNIAELWETDLQGHAVAAVPDLWAASQCKALQIPEGIYFNAGIIIADLAIWRDESINKKAMDYIFNNTQVLKYHEQDALNALLFNDWIPLPASWNAHSTVIKEWNNPSLPAAIHYTGLSKPWHFDNIHPFKQEYYKYLRLTEWRDYKPEINLRRIIKRLTRPMMPVLEQILPRSAIMLLHKYKSILNKT
jgi:lipopolysaccharide biosynthesis glycosyltransferase